MVKRSITIGHLYPKQMNVYGDMGNVITLQYRLKARGIDTNYVSLDSICNIKKSNVDILIGGGGQDSNQGLIQQDLLSGANELKQLCDNGLVCLMICGMYQLFGTKFVTQDGDELIGAGIIDVETRASNDRLIGNIVVDSQWGKMVGFENHSGRTYLGNAVKELGKVIKGAGNNGGDKTEGCVVNNVFGTYMHGPVLAKNPEFADELISRALVQQGGSGSLDPIDDSLENLAAQIARARPR
ncbi:glutamine amidotransferase [Candidatus Nomurabacteria bacterium]|nr:glutamine amidotransferase [Candidatus Nomurabacteria bacterium]